MKEIQKEGKEAKIDERNKKICKERISTSMK